MLVGPVHDGDDHSLGPAVPAGDRRDHNADQFASCRYSRYRSIDLVGESGAVAVGVFEPSAGAPCFGDAAKSTVRFADAKSTARVDVIGVIRH